VPDSSGLPSWAELTEEQRCILYEGLTGHSLVDVLNGWVGWACAADAPYWNRKSAYVGPLARAARALVESGLIEVWEQPVGVGEGGLMVRDLALEAVGNHENWWQYDPDGNWDPGEDLTRYAEFAGADTDPATAMYLVISTHLARDQGLVRVWPDRT
jgi:hypothetical protein